MCSQGEGKIEISKAVGVSRKFRGRESLEFGVEVTLRGYRPRKKKRERSSLLAVLGEDATMAGEATIATKTNEIKKSCIQKPHYFDSSKRRHSNHIEGNHQKRF